MSFGERTLREPGMWGERDAGPPCGAEGLVITAPGGPYRVLGLSNAQSRGLRVPLRLVEVRKDPAVELQVCRASARDFLPDDPKRWEYPFDVEHGSDRVLMAGPGFVARLLLRPRFGAVMWTAEVEGSGFETAFANVLRVVVAYRMVDCGGAVVHSAAVVDHDAALVFVGVSGSGKSTISRLALESGRSVLSDDLNALDIRQGRPVAEAMPLAGDFRGREVMDQVPVSHLYRLRHGGTPLVRPMTSAEVVALLMACAPFVNSDPHRRAQLLVNIETISRNLSGDELTFPVGGHFWNLVSPGKVS